MNARGASTRPTAGAEGGIQTGVLKAGHGVHAAADFARSHIPGDNPISNAARGAITAEGRAKRGDAPQAS